MDTSVPTPRLYDDLAWLWPVISPPSHYVAEAETLNALIAQRLGGGPKRILELGAGGGHTLVHLSALSVDTSRDAGGWGGIHESVAADLSDAMLAHCRALIPGIETHTGDMRSLRLDQTFDAVLIHDAIDYLLTEDDLRRTLHNAHAHLKPGGLAFVAPTYSRETFHDGEVADDGTATDAEEVTFFSYVHDPDPADTTFEMILLYLLRDRATRKVEVIEDRHTCGLFDNATWMQLMQDAGFGVEFIEQETGAWTLFLGTA